MHEILDRVYTPKSLRTLLFSMNVAVQARLFRRLFTELPFPEVLLSIPPFFYQAVGIGISSTNYEVVSR